MIADPELHRLFKAESEEHLARLDDGLLRLEKTPGNPDLLEEVFRESHSLKGAARMLGLTRIETAAHELEGIFNAARKGEAPLTPETIERMNARLTDLRQRVREALATNADSGRVETKTGETGVERPQPEIPDPQPFNPPSDAPHSNTPFQFETIRVETGKLDDLLTQVGELSVLQGQAQHRMSLLEALQEQWAALERGRHAYAPPEETEANRARFGNLLKQARETFFDDNARLQSIVQRLNDQVGNMRLLPLSTLFAFFPRMVRDLAKELNKEVDLVLEGGDVTVDKRILEEMKDPLMHLIRNAIDHGIEAPSERERLGKPRRARLVLRAVRRDACVLLEVEDDGQGLDSTAIRREIRKRGLVDDASLAAMMPEQLQRLILISGFSTSPYVTELSGRGVGLDIVRANVERLKGSLHLESSPGKGTTVGLLLPLSLAATRLLLASCGGRIYGLPVEFVQTSRRVRAEQVFMLDGRPAILVDGEAVIVAPLSDLLELPAAGETVPAAASGEFDVSACVVLMIDRQRLGLLIDDLPGEEEVVPKTLGAPLKRVRNVAALAILGSGETCVILNPSDLLRSAHKKMPHAPPMTSPAINTPPSKLVLLLAEDSALIRAMEKRILEDAGYEVVTAVDGLDALNLLGSRPFAAVVTDIVMPNMDGLTLTARIRGDTRYRNLPVILITSLASDEDKRRGLDAGANAYIPKPTFDQKVLLDTLKRQV